MKSTNYGEYKLTLASEILSILLVGWIIIYNYYKLYTKVLFPHEYYNRVFSIQKPLIWELLFSKLFKYD